MPRLIDADALMAIFQEAQKSFEQDGVEYSCSFMSNSQELSTEWYCVEDMLDNAPTIDAVPVVRCRECRHNGQPPDKGFAQCELDALIREPEFWCRAGQREDGDA